MNVKSLSCIRFFATPWTAAHQAPPSVGFSRQECWSGVPLPSPVHETGYVLGNWLCADEEAGEATLQGHGVSSLHPYVVLMLLSF